MNEQDKAYRFWVHNLPGVGDRTIEKLLLTFGNEKAIYEADEKILNRILDKEKTKKIFEFTAKWDLQGAYGKLLEQKIRFFTRKDKEYPCRLRRLKHPPYGIYCIGNLPQETTPAAAIIGARECSEYGSFVARAFAGKLASAQITVISGMARGIDGIAQQSAVHAGGTTFAVLGCGVDVCYPASNKGLYDQIISAGGGILSVFPPGTMPQKRNFPERNRIVAGLSDVLLVVEARQKSGTWITVDMALDQGKNIYAVPGRLTDRLSDGCNLLIRQGAGIALSPEDLIREIEVLANRKEVAALEEVPTLNPVPAKQQDDLLSFLDFAPHTADEILQKMKQHGKEISLQQLLPELIMLCMKGQAKQEAGYYMKIETAF